MTVLSHPYSDSGIVAADVFASFTEHTHNSRLLLLNGVKVCGVWYIDSMNALRSGYGPSVMMDDVDHPYGLLLSASNTECVGVILSGSAFEWIPVLAPRREKPHWAVSASSGTVDAALLTEAGIDPLPAVSTNLSLFLVPTICPFTFKLPTFDNLGPEDMSELAEAHGSDVVEWARSCVTLAPGLTICPPTPTSTDHVFRRSHARLAPTQTTIGPCFPASAGPRPSPPFPPRRPSPNRL